MSGDAGNSPSASGVGMAMSIDLIQTRSTRGDRADPLQAALDGTGLALF